MMSSVSIALWTRGRKDILENMKGTSAVMCSRVEHRRGSPNLAWAEHRGRKSYRYDLTDAPRQGAQGKGKKSDHRLTGFQNSQPFVTPPLRPRLLAWR